MRIMAYPIPSELSSRETLYKEAMFFYDRYEEMKAEAIELARESWNQWAYPRGNNNEYLTSGGLSTLKEIEDFLKRWNQIDENGQLKQRER